MDDQSELLRELSEGVLWITINRPDQRNSLNSAMRDRLSEWFLEASNDLHVRCIVLTAAGEKAFCTGADLRSSGTPASRPEGAPDRASGEVARVIQQGWQRLVTSILDCEKPVIGAINGTAAGGGMHLALACDLLISADTAKFIEVFIRRGIAPDAAGAWLLTRLVGIQRAKELFFLGDDVTAQRAEALGLVNWVVPAASLRAETEVLAARLAAGPTRALAITKALTNRALDVDRATSLLEEAWGQEQVTTSEDMKEGVAAFIERREPNFKGF